jgi:3-oxoacyl-[acyl-carrier protein] reductase
MKKVVITGAANGIGKATVLACLKQGFYVIAADKDEEGLTALQRTQPGDRLEVHVADFSKRPVFRSFIPTLRSRFGHDSLDALVNNAGLYHGKSVYDYSDEEIDEICALNLQSLVYLSRDFARQSPRPGVLRSIVNITSVAGEVGSFDALYGATKAGVIGLTKANAWNFAP